MPDQNDVLAGREGEADIFCGSSRSTVFVQLFCFNQTYAPPTWASYFFPTNARIAPKTIRYNNLFDNIRIVTVKYLMRYMTDR